MKYPITKSELNSMRESSKAAVHHSFIIVHSDNISREVIKAALRGDIEFSYPIYHNDPEVLLCVERELIKRFPDSDIKLLGMFVPNVSRLIVVNWS